MTEAVVSGKDTHCPFINNSDDLLNLKKVVSKKSHKDDCEKQKNQKYKEINGSKLNKTLKTTPSMYFDIDNTSSLERNLEMDSDTDKNITIDSICIQEEHGSEKIDDSNENSSFIKIKNGEKDIQEISMNNEYSHDLIADDLDIVKSPASYFNISSMAPLCNSDTDKKITIDSICIQEEHGSEKVEDSNENSSFIKIKNGEKDIQEISMNNEYSHDLVDDDLDSVNSLASSFNISSIAPLCNSDTDENITIDSICIQEEHGSEKIDDSNENSNFIKIKNGEKDIQEISIKESDDDDLDSIKSPASYFNNISSRAPLCNYYSEIESSEDEISTLEEEIIYSEQKPIKEISIKESDDDLDSIKSPASYFSNISSRAPLSNYYNEMESWEDEISTLEEEIISKKKKRKFEDIPEEQKPSKLLKLWNDMKFPFKKITIGTSMYTNKSNITEATKKIINKVEESSVPVTTICENDSHFPESEEINKLNKTETEHEIENISENTKNKQTFCSLM